MMQSADELPKAADFDAAPNREPNANQQDQDI